VTELFEVVDLAGVPELGELREVVRFPAGVPAAVASWPCAYVDGEDGRRLIVAWSRCGRLAFLDPGWWGDPVDPGVRAALRALCGEACDGG
jgi:hypothetical protein